MKTYVAYLSCQAYEDTDFRILYAGDNYESALIAAETATSYLGTPYTYVQTWVDGSIIKEIEVQN